MSKKSHSSERKRQRIRWSIRRKVKGTPERPRLSVFKSNRSVYCQLIDDVNGITLASAQSNSGELNKGSRIGTGRSGRTGYCQQSEIYQRGYIVFDRGGYPYHGIVKALAEGARKGGLKF
jgi:large subunit ribosomal protein L18